MVAIKDLRNNNNVEIMEMNKGRSALILSKSCYKSMILSQLNDEKNI